MTPIGLTQWLPWWW